RGRVGPVRLHDQGEDHGGSVQGRSAVAADPAVHRAGPVEAVLARRAHLLPRRDLLRPHRIRAEGLRVTTTRQRTALVTGAGRGLGRDIAALLADRGYQVTVTDLDAETAAAAAAEIGRGATSAVVDVRDHAQVEQARDTLVAESGGIDVWVNNAGVLLTGSAWDQSAEQRKLHLDVNTLGTINGTVAAIDAMRGVSPGSRGRGGHIINIASLAGISAVPGEAVYAASKHAVMGFSSSTTADLRLAGVTDIDISCICPDGIWTPMLYDKLEDPRAALSFSGVLLQPSDVVRAVGK